MLLPHADVAFIGRTYKRHGDVERRVMLRVVRELHAAGRDPRTAGRCIEGVVDVYVDRLTCLSCIGALAQFQRVLPAVRLRLASAYPPWLPRKLPYERYY